MFPPVELYHKSEIDRKSWAEDFARMFTSSAEIMLRFSPMKRWNFAILAIALIALSGCSHPMSMKSPDGVTYDGRYRFGRDDSGLMQIYGPEHEVLIGRFARSRSCLGR